MFNGSQSQGAFNLKQIESANFLSAARAKAMMRCNGRVDTTLSNPESLIPRRLVSSIEGRGVYVVYRSLINETLRLEVKEFVNSPYLDDDAKEFIVHSSADALSFLSVIPEHLDRPSASYSDDGEVVFTWVKNDLRAEVGFPGDSYIEYTYRLEGRFVSGKFNCTVSEFPKDLLEYLK